MATFTSYEQGTPSWVELVTPDPEAGAAFYRDLFGWEVEVSPIPGGGEYRMAQLEGDSIAGISGQMPGLEGHPAFWGVYLTVDDVDATTARVAELGGEVEAGPFDVLDSGRMSALKDPSGARVNLWQPREHIGTGRANEPGTPTWNELVVPDPEKGVTFYEQLLGLTSEAMDMGGQGTYLTLQVNGRSIAGATQPPMEGLPPHWNVYFNVADVDAAVTAVEKGGGKAVAPAFDVPTVGRMAMVSDPDGAMFWLMQNPD